MGPVPENDRIDLDRLGPVAHSPPAVRHLEELHMFIKASRIQGITFALVAVGIAAFTACSSDDTTPTGTAGTGNTSTQAGTGNAAGSGTGGSPGTAGMNSTAGTPAGGSATGGAASGGTSNGGAAMGGAGGGKGFACKGTKPTTALITGFEDSVANATEMGQFNHTLGVPGGTFTYPKADMKVDVMGKNFNVKGNVKTYSGMGIYFNDCLDAAGAGATGVSFKIKATKLDMGGMMTFKVQTNANHQPANMKGTCDAMGLAVGADYMYCHDATFAFPVTASETEVSVTWDKLADGMPSATVNGKDVIGLEWAFSWMEMGTAYDADVTIDDVKWTGTITGGGGGGTGGAGGMGGTGGASAGAGGAAAGTGGMGGTGGTN
jgi:hypothetical protein